MILAIENYSILGLKILLVCQIKNLKRFVHVRNADLAHLSRYLSNPNPSRRPNPFIISAVEYISVEFAQVSHSYSEEMIAYSQKNELSLKMCYRVVRKIEFNVASSKLETFELPYRCRG